MIAGEIYHLQDVQPLHAGAPKGRYVVVVTSSQDIALDRPLFVVACSASVRPEQVDSGRAIALPWSRQARAMTGFRKPTYAFPEWMLEVRPSQLGRKVGHVPGTILAAILDRLPPDPHDRVGDA